MNDPPLTGIQVIQVRDLPGFLNPFTRFPRQQLQVVVLRAPGGTLLTITIPTTPP